MNKVFKLKDLINKAIFGFVFGIGLCLALFISSFLFDYFQDSEKPIPKKIYSEEVQLVILDQHKSKMDDSLLVLAKVKNDSSDIWTRIEVEAEIFDSNGLFIDECRDFIHDQLNPTESENFEIVCRGWKNKEISDIGKITVSIKKAEFVRSKNT